MMTAALSRRDLTDNRQGCVTALQLGLELFEPRRG